MNTYMTKNLERRYWSKIDILKIDKSEQYEKDIYINEMQGTRENFRGEIDAILFKEELQILESREKGATTNGNR